MWAAGFAYAYSRSERLLAGRGTGTGAGVYWRVVGRSLAAAAGGGVGGGRRCPRAPSLEVKKAEAPASHPCLPQPPPSERHFPCCFPPTRGDPLGGGGGMGESGGLPTKEAAKGRRASPLVPPFPSNSALPTPGGHSAAGSGGGSRCRPLPHRPARVCSSRGASTAVGAAGHCSWELPGPPPPRRRVANKLKPSSASIQVQL